METLGHLGVQVVNSWTSRPLNHFRKSYPNPPSRFYDEL